jgi:hypothetical protein
MDYSDTLVTLGTQNTRPRPVKQKTTAQHNTIQKTEQISNTDPTNNWRATPGGQ